MKLIMISVNQSSHITLKSFKKKKKLRKFWSGINELINNNKKAQQIPIVLHAKGKVIDKPKEIANHFNNFFANVACNLLKKLGHTDKNFHSYLRNPCNNSIFINHISPDEDKDLLAGLDSRKAQDLYQFPVGLKDIICEPLSIIFNKCIEIGVYPDKLKVAKVIPFYKEGNRTELGNYRPVSILPILDKNLEKLISKRLVSFYLKTTL